MVTSFKLPLPTGDKSRKGSVDAPIEGLIALINARGDVYTTSSCSGRISVFAEPNEVWEAVWSSQCYGVESPGPSDDGFRNGLEDLPPSNDT